ncbi:hypothetical protein CJF42_15510 [Pseudoalteromonas sp. NBT06-2]|uniref:GspH/FimT family pseudopilin n=1 Tax=Pseudoalteromonas sp. NBT06-2 TaxID=2025950 RepID=UPI000BA72F5B|nr:GspH/FimT family pseudopilin [Pseudoalteromonas sp. NBT06-2]PAJ73494.1 hypothetical protein CJF42_15510 [Pseudoalteromonas sp. NBT06-2]
MNVVNQLYSNHLKNGFSLLELMTTCSIVGILLTISSPSYIKLLAENERDNTLSSLKKSLMFTRIFAIQKNENITLCPLEAGKCVKQWNKEVSIFVDSNSNQQLDKKDYLLKVIDKINVNHILTYPRNAVTYRADASLDGFQSGSFIYCLPESLDVKGKRITVSQAGRIRIRNTNNC